MAVGMTSLEKVTLKLKLEDDLSEPRERGESRESVPGRLKSLCKGPFGEYLGWGRNQGGNDQNYCNFR